MRHLLATSAVLFALACSSSAPPAPSPAGADAGPSVPGSDGGGGGGGGAAGGRAGGSGTTDSGGTGGGDAGGSPAATCAAPIQAVDVSKPTTVIGDGTPASCTEQALTDAIAKAGVITFKCGGPATIHVTATKELAIDKDTVIDGGDVVTLDGGHAARVFHFASPDFRATRTTVTLQHLTIANAKATGTMLPPAPPPCSQGYDVDGGGAGIWMRDGVLHVIDVTFANNEGASPGPDVGGGGVYVEGSLEAIIVGSRFRGNSASNAGAVASLFSNLTLVNDVFEDNKSTGSGENYIDPSCTVNGGESGNGGNGGAIAIDGAEDFEVVVCGSVFRNNQAGALGGGIFRTPDGNVEKITFDRSLFDGNTAVKGGGAMYIHHSTLTITASTLANNTSSESGGAVQCDDTDLEATNSTFANNAAKAGLGGAIALFGNGGKIQNCTFAGNHADGGSGLFGGALVGDALVIANTIFASNTSQDCDSPMACGGTHTGAGDVQWPTNHVACASPDPPCAPGAAFGDPKLGALGDHGGPTPTMVPGAGSAALGAGGACPATDQRGVARADASKCTAGAVEVN